MDAKLLPGIMMFCLSVICVACIVTGLVKVMGKTAFSKQLQQRIAVTTATAIVLWMGLIGLLAANGFFANFTPFPRPALLIMVPLPFILLIAFSKRVAVILMAVPPHWLVGMQAFRIVVELLLLKAYLGGLLPKQMTFEGGNFDIISGILAIPFAIMVAKNKSRLLIKWYNVIGIVLLLNILVIAVLSMPTPLRQFMNEPSNSIIGDFPFIYLPGVLVVIGYSLHIFSLRQVFLLKNNSDYRV